MEEQLISFETAILAKEKKFNISCRYCTCNNVQLPTQSLLQKWLREVHNIEVYVTPVKEITNDFKYYQWMIHTISFGIHDTYEKALEAGLIEALKLIK